MQYYPIIIWENWGWFSGDVISWATCTPFLSLLWTTIVVHDKIHVQWTLNTHLQHLVCKDFIQYVHMCYGTTSHSLPLAQLRMTKSSLKSGHSSHSNCEYSCLQSGDEDSWVQHPRYSATSNCTSARECDIVLERYCSFNVHRNDGVHITI